MSVHPPHVPWPFQELHRRLQGQGLHGVPATMPAQSSRASWPHKELHRRPQRQGPHGVPRKYRRTPRSNRGPGGNSTDGLNGRVQSILANKPPANKKYENIFRPREKKYFRPGSKHISAPRGKIFRAPEKKYFGPREARPKIFSCIILIVCPPA